MIDLEVFEDIVKDEINDELHQLQHSSDDTEIILALSGNSSLSRYERNNL